MSKNFLLPYVCSEKVFKSLLAFLAFVIVASLQGCSSGLKDTERNHTEAPSTDVAAEAPVETTYPASARVNVRLFPTVESAKEFFSSSIDEMESKRDFLESLPSVSEDEKVTAEIEKHDDYRLVTTHDGASGYIQAASLSLSPAELREEINKDPNVQMATTFFKSHPSPPTISKHASWKVGNLQLKITGCERCKLIGKKDSNSWAESEDDNTFLVLNYTVKNLSKEPEDFPQNSILRSKNGEFCRLSDLGCGAYWESKHIDQFSQISPGKTVKYAGVYYVPNSTPDGDLILLMANLVSVDHLYPVQVSLN